MYACVCLLLGRAEHLHDDGVAAGERGPQLPGLHHQREVPALSSSVTPAADRPATLLLTELVFHGTGRHEESKRARTFRHIYASRLLPRVCTEAKVVTRRTQPSPWDDLAHDANRLFQGIYVQLAICWDCLACTEERDCVQHRTLCFADALSMLLRYCK